MCKTGGRIFIGFPTHQETGTAFHLFSQVIPTIERENLDFNYPCIKKWNKQLIQIAGRIMRLYFCYEVSRIAKQAENDTISPHPGMDRIINLIKALPFEPTAPSKKVGELLMKGFFDPKFGSQNLSLPTQKGNLARTTQVRLPHLGMENFTELFVVHPRLLEDRFSKSFCTILERQFILRPASKRDINRYFERNVLTEERLGEVLTWFVSAQKKEIERDKGRQSYLVEELPKLEELTKNLKYTNNTWKGDNPPLNFSRVKYYVEEDTCIDPNTTLPYSLGRLLLVDDLLSVLKLIPLPFMEWFRYMITITPEERKDKIGVSDDTFYSTILMRLSVHWNSLPTREEILTILSSIPCISTDKGCLLRPSEVYFPSVTFPEDLAHISEHLAFNIPPGILREIGIMSAAPLDQVLPRIHEEGLGVRNIVNYLISQQSSLRPEDKTFLREVPFLPSINGTGTFRACNLHFKSPELLGIGIYLLDWPDDVTSAEERFLVSLGVRKFPSIQVIFSVLCNLELAENHMKLFDYFVRHFDDYEKDYKRIDEIPAVIPTSSGTMVKPQECYSYSVPSLLKEYLGCPVIHDHYLPYAPMLQIKRHPKLSYIIKKLSESPPSMIVGFILFEYLYERISEFEEFHLDRLREIPFIPWTDPTTKQLSWFKISEVFAVTLQSEFGPLLRFVDFSPKGNLFLKHIGVSELASIDQVASGMVAHFSEYLDSFGSEMYEKMLIKIAKGYNTLNAKTKKDLKETPILLAYKCIDTNETESRVVVTTKASKCFLIDNSDYQRLFNPLSGPLSLSPELINLYEKLGCRWISSVVTKKSEICGDEEYTERCEQLEVILEERTNLLLYDLQTLSLHTHLHPGACDTLRYVRFLEVPRIKQNLTFKDKVHDVEVNTHSVINPVPRHHHHHSPRIYFTSNAEPYEISSEIARLIFTKPKFHDITTITSLLTTSLNVLRRQGYAIDKLLEAPFPSEEEVSQEDHFPHHSLIIDIPNGGQEQQQERVLSIQPQPQLPNQVLDPQPQSLRLQVTEHQLQPQGLIQNPQILQHEQMREDRNVEEQGEEMEPFLRVIDLKSIEADQKQKENQLLLNSHTTNIRNSFYSLQKLCSHVERSISLQEISNLKKKITTSCCLLQSKFFSYHRDVNSIPFLIDTKLKEVNKELDEAALDMSLVLKKLMEIMKVTATACVMVLDLTNIIARNTNGVVHFNVYYYYSLNHTRDQMDTWLFWYLTFAHQLAHNIETDHSPKHQIVYQSLVQNTFLDFMNVLEVIRSSNGSAFLGECLICCDNLIDMCILECGHLAVCHRCSGELQKCPICRRNISRVIPVFVG
eukprot:TRINITY_DN426_c0_g2_i9.p1 TRINITY_DN426_c0_g2~~TRINITY_DN426_c0_g2_i9.p1  ORF type:complete len:1325 (-),score=265.51 TRINITY_DN426_c0_g2_i9:49-4023(-)